MAGYIGSTPVPQGIQEQQSFTATAGQTTFNTLGYTDGNTIRVTLNGVLLEGAGVDYTATNGSDIVLTAAASVDDVLTFETFNEFQLVSQTMTTPTISGGTLKSNVTLKNDTEQDTDGGRASKIIYQGEQSGGEISTLAEIQASHDGTADDEKGDLIFRTNDGSDGTSPTTAMTIDSAQNVGIGTSSPSTRMHIVPPDNTTANKITQSFGSARANANDVIAGGFDSEFVTRDGNVNTGAFIRVIDTNTHASFPTTIRGGAISFGTVDGTSGATADATERMRILPAGGLTFNGDTAAANALDDYEEGTFSPVITGSSGSSGQSYSSSIGYYTKVGNMVNFWFHVQLSNEGTHSGTNIILGNLPYTLSSGTAGVGGGSINFASNLGVNVFGSLVLNSFPSTTAMYVNYGDSDSPDPITNSVNAIANTTRLDGFGSYRTA